MPESSPTSQLTVVSLVGFQGAGKSELSKKLAWLYGLKTHVEVSAVVKAMHEGLTRDQLPETAKLTHTSPDWLANELYDLMFNDGALINVLSGVREPQIHDYLKKKGVRLEILEVRCPAPVRYRRVHTLGKVDTVDQFIRHELDEINMGLREVLEQAPYALVTGDDTNPALLAKAIKLKLEKEGVK